MTYYEILQVSTDASEEVIKAAYKSLVKKYHPDSGTMSDADKFMQVEDAYQVLGNPEKRQLYDERLKATAEKRKDEIVVQQKKETASTTSTSRTTSSSRTSGGSSFFENLLGFLLLGFIVYSWFGNAEKLRIELWNAIGIQTFSTAEETCEVYFSFDFNKSFLKDKADVWVNIDGDRVRLLAYGDSDAFAYELSKGQHIVFVETKTLHINSSKQVIQVTEDGQVFSYKLKGRSTVGIELYN